jgi:excisionase family DNA binding protein
MGRSNMELTKEFFTLNEVAHVMGVSRQTVVKWRKEGVMRAGRMGHGRSAWKVHRQELERIMKAQGG